MELNVWVAWDKTKMGVCKKSRKQLEKGTAKIWHFPSQVCKEHGLRQKGIWFILEELNDIF